MQAPSSNQHDRTQFQIDRVAFFSDAVIAIAITLMVLEIKIPELGENATVGEILSKYADSLILHTLALLVGFWTIGNLWMKHHELFEHIVNYNKQMIRANLYFLLSIMLLPITISFLFTSHEPKKLQLLVYFLNLFLCSITFSWMLVVVFHKKNNFHSAADKAEVIKMKKNAYLGCIVFFLVVVVVWFNRDWYYAIFLIIPASRLIARFKGGKKSI